MGRFIHQTEGIDATLQSPVGYFALTNHTLRVTPKRSVISFPIFCSYFFSFSIKCWKYKKAFSSYQNCVNALFFSDTVTSRYYGSERYGNPYITDTHGLWLRTFVQPTYQPINQKTKQEQKLWNFVTCKRTKPMARRRPIIRQTTSKFFSIVLNDSMIVVR